MKKTLIALMMALVAMLLFVSCDNKTKEPKTYTVTFDSNGGSDVPSQTVTEGDKAVKPENPTTSAKYKTVDYWTLDGKKFDFETTAVTADITLKAVWRDYEIGDIGPSGGYIFYKAETAQNVVYTDSSGKKVTLSWIYLEAAKKDLTPLKWYDDGTTSRGASFDWNFSAQIGMGFSNTMDLVKNGENYVAANEVWGQTIDGYSDWFLPSWGELEAMYTNLHKKGVGNFKNGKYWSSSPKKNSSLDSYCFNFENGTLLEMGRGSSLQIRPVRCF